MKQENIHFDLASLHQKVRPEAYPFPTAQRFINLAKDIVGTEHLMWGTDALSTLVQYSYEQLLEYQMSLSSEAEQRLVFHDNAQRLYFS